jgi:hypothetical protein
MGDVMKKYTVSEIDRMREAVASNMGAYEIDLSRINVREFYATVEDRLRTYIAIGAAAEDIEAQDQFIDPHYAAYCFSAPPKGNDNG